MKYDPPDKIDIDDPNAPDPEEIGDIWDDDDDDTGGDDEEE
jgi:hypothetical protein